MNRISGRLADLRYRLRSAWAVLTGRAVAMTGTYWSPTSTTTEPGQFRWEMFQ